MAGQTAAEFVREAEAVLRVTSPGDYLTTREGFIDRAYQQFNEGIAQEIADAIPDSYQALMGRESVGKS